ncbi:MAG: phosphoesterase, MJ0936 family [uncultured archaeon A07HR60]|nr:MAG: phosphoesterase, MJ0936 family [uncultured archaeon A07HR60]
MLVLISDTHGSDTHRLEGRTLQAVRDAEVVVHAGDFCEPAVLTAFEQASKSFLGVYGNNDGDVIRSRLPESRVVEYGNTRLAVCHTRRGGRQELSLFGRQENADAVVYGHSHRPGIDEDGPIPLVNPGSHAQSRGHGLAHAELQVADDGLDGQLLSPQGDTLRSFSIQSD